MSESNFSEFWKYFWTSTIHYTHKKLDKKNRQNFFNATKRYKEMIEELIVVSGLRGAFQQILNLYFDNFSE